MEGKYDISPPGVPAGTKFVIPYGQTDCNDEYMIVLRELAEKFISVIRENPSGIYASQYLDQWNEMLLNANTAAWLMTLLDAKFIAAMSSSRAEWKIVPVGRPRVVELQNMLMYAIPYASPGWLLRKRGAGYYDIFPNFWFNIKELEKILKNIGCRSITDKSKGIITSEYREQLIFIAVLKIKFPFREVRISYYPDGIIIDMVVHVDMN